MVDGVLDPSPWKWKGLVGRVCTVGHQSARWQRRLPQSSAALSHNPSGSAAGTSDDVEVVSCKEPHSAEATGAKLNGKPGDTFPGSDKVQSQAVKFCLPLGQKFLGGKRSDIIASQNSGGSAPWSRGLMVTGCFVEVTNGTVKKSLRGIGNKPLDSYR